MAYPRTRETLFFTYNDHLKLDISNAWADSIGVEVPTPDDGTIHSFVLSRGGVNTIVKTWLGTLDGMSTHRAFAAIRSLSERDYLTSDGVNAAATYNVGRLGGIRVEIADECVELRRSITLDNGDEHSITYEINHGDMVRLLIWATHGEDNAK